MKDGKGKGGKSKKGSGLNEEDFRLWREFTRDVDPMTEPDWEAIEATLDKSPPATSLYGEVPLKPSVKPALKNSNAVQQSHQLDLRTELRLRRGQMPIDGRIDLHGRNQEQAHRLLEEFVLSSHARGKRCLLVITGKGKGGLTAQEAYAHDLQPGILKQKVPQWLSMPPLGSIILKTYPAVPRDGGGGALYVYLKRAREYQY